MQSSIRKVTTIENARFVRYQLDPRLNPYVSRLLGRLTYFPMCQVSTKLYESKRPLKIPVGHR